MHTQKQLDAANLYAALMEEVKLRIGAIDAGTMNKLPLLPPLVREFCFLQLRMVCELIALGCLVAHGDITADKAKKLHKQWAADKIIEELEKLHPEFFPVQAKHTVGTDGVWQFGSIKPGPLPKNEFLKLYHQCGEVLHRGSMKKILSQKQPVVIHYPDITKLAQKIVDLLTIHSVTMLGGKQMFLCALNQANVRAQVAIAEHLEQPSQFEAPASSAPSKR